MSNPRTGKFDQNVTVSWSDGTLFTGYAYVGIIKPTYGANDDALYMTVRNFGSAPSRVPDRIPVPIVEGKYNNSLALFYNADLVPPGSVYAMELFDSTKRLVSSQSSNFTVTTDPFTPPVITPTAPTTGTSFPAPNS